VFDAKTHAEVTKQTAEREVGELTRQRDAVTNQLTQLREMLSGLAGLGTLPTEQQATVEEAAEKVEDVREAVDEATAGDSNGESEGSELRVGNAG
jgi:hypothetical protein